MGASDSKLVFKQGIFKLSEQQNISADDPYWTGFWELPESAEDIFSLFSPTDIRRTRDHALGNFETLILAVASRLCVLRNHPSFPDPELAPERDALNCIRVLTRLLPFVYEEEHLEGWEEKFFWGARRKRTRKGQIARSEVLFDGATSPDNETPTQKEPEFEEAKPLAEELIDTLVDLLFFSDFTLPKTAAGKNKVTWAIWQTGVGCNTPITATKEFENNRAEILRLLIVICSKSLYMTSNVLPIHGVRAITYLTTCPDKQTVLSVLCSLLNTTLKYNPAAWRVPYDHVVFKDSRQSLVTYCLQLLLILVLYPVPETGRGPPPRNNFRYFLGRLHRPQDFQFIVDGMNRILNQPLQATGSYFPGIQKSVTWAPEMIMLFWETLQCNKRFRSFIIDTERAHDFVVLILFYALNQRTDPSKQGIIRMCVFVLQTMSVEPNFGKSLNKTFEGQETLPASIRIANFHGSYADYLITSIHTLLTTSKGKLDAVYPALLAIINNIAPHVENLGRAPSLKLLQLFNSMSSPKFLLANETNHVLLRSLLEALNAIVEHRYDSRRGLDPLIGQAAHALIGNPHLILAILRSKNHFEALREFTLESGQEELERLKAKMEAETASLTRENSIDGTRSPAVARAPSLGNVPEEDNGAFAIGDDEDSDEDQASTPIRAQSSTHSMHSSRAASISSLADDAVPLQLRGMSEKARGKMPAGQPSFSRQNSTTSLNSLTPSTVGVNGSFTPTAEWIETWLPELPLHTILTVITELSSQVPPAESTNDTAATLAAIRKADVRGIEPSPVRVHLFEWSALSLGWYESLLWGFIFTSEMLVSKGSAAGVWTGTAIRLFKVQEMAAQTPSLLAPRGAVDAVGSNLVQSVQRIGSLSLRSASGAASPGNGSGPRQQNGSGNNGPMTVRDV
ncbi:hypothetical protein NA57DRAFT_78640 [Rhizodiscina lignyota]|uniref:High-temperature-induced dauer-formation protein n=1 Tax=Rhizodiscina lignyota TaxID=1504668 RepID=A0A9P4M3L6_9PEZI|nr:hypothetical protein NA57DRAFT_78640 [Rhizodiscina lignyota]